MDAGLILPLNSTQFDPVPESESFEVQKVLFLTSAGFHCLFDFFQNDELVNNHIFHFLYILFPLLFPPHILLPF